MKMTGKDARSLLEIMRTKWVNPTAFFKAAEKAGLSNSAFGKLLHAKDNQTLADLKKVEEKQLTMF